MTKKLGQESLPEGQFHLCIISSLCLVKPLSHGANFLCLVFNLALLSLQVHHGLPHFLAGIGLLSATPCPGFLYGRVTFELALGLPMARVSNAVSSKQQK